MGDDPEKAEKVEAETKVVETASTAANAAKWTGWMATGVTSITSKLYAGPKTVPTQPGLANAQAAGAALARSAAANVKSEEVSPATATTTATTAQTAVTQGQCVKKAKDNKPEEEEDNNEEDFGGGGWDDMEADGGNWEEIEPTGNTRMSKKSTRRLVKNSHKRAIEDELWQGLDHADEVQQLETQQVTADQVKEPEPTAADDGWGNSWGDETNEFEVEETKDGDGATGGGGGWNEDSWNDSWNETSTKEKKKPVKKTALKVSAVGFADSSSFGWDESSKETATGGQDDFFDNVSTSLSSKTSLGRQTLKQTSQV